MRVCGGGIDRATFAVAHAKAARKNGWRRSADMEEQMRASFLALLIQIQHAKPYLRLLVVKLSPGVPSGVPDDASHMVEYYTGH